MSIFQITQNQTLPLYNSHQKPSGDKQLPSSSFSEAINNASLKLNKNEEQSPATIATTAAELLKLEMMKSALSLGDDAASITSGTLSYPAKLATNEIIPERRDIDISAKTIFHKDEIASIEPSNSKSEKTLEDLVNKASLKFGVDSSLIKAVIKAESNFNPSAVSHAGAQGLMQLMPSTARGLGVKDSFNPEQNVMAGTRFLKDMLNRYNGNIDSALAAYNWGPGNVDRKGTSSLPHETREYLVKVKSYYNQYIG